MAYHFYCGQYDREYAPKRMRNWEVPRWAPSRPRPLPQRPDPRPIATLDGRFLPGVPRGSSGPFGHHVGTWDMPTSITRKVAEELSRQPPEGRFQSWVHPRTQRADIPPKGKRHAGEKQAAAAPAAGPAPPRADRDHKFVDTQDDNLKSDHSQPEETSKSDQEPTQLERDICVWNDVKQPFDDHGNGPYVPGSLTEPNQRHESYDLLVEKAVEEVHGPQESKEDKFWRKVAENSKLKEQESEAEGQENMRDHHPRNRIQRQDPVTKLPSVTAQTGFHYARKLHMENLEHNPLPDSLGYRYLTKVGQERESDIVVKPYAIAWKGYGASGPTSCTKMRVHRPKTSDPKQNEKQNIKARPSTCLENKKPMTRMDLAICWDYRPSDQNQEPKPPKHIDGSNGSKAPAVFTMVRTPKEEEDPFPISAHPNPIFTQSCAPDNMEPHHMLPYFEKDMSKNRHKDSCEVQNCPQHSQYTRDNARHSASVSSRKSSTNSAGSHKLKHCDGVHGCGTPIEESKLSLQKNEVRRPEKLKAITEAWSNKVDDAIKKELKYPNDRKRDSLESYEKTSLAQGKLHQSSPDLSQSSKTSKDAKERPCNNKNGKHKHCISCNSSKSHAPENKPKNEYKSAFKAGNPNSVQSSSSTNGSTDSKNLKIPKMRDPYAKKSYSIPTLAPPFCIWRDASNSGYPEHWRLASVYQHAYKPIEQRRKPLLASVFQ